MSTPSDSAVSPMSGTAAAPRSAFAPLRDRTFALYLSGQLLSQIGDGVYLVALPFLVLGRGGGVGVLGVVLAVYGVARLGMFPVGGTLADRWGARRLMLTTDVLRAVVVLGFVALATSATVPMWALIAVAVPFGMLDGLFMPASLAVLPRLVPPASLPACNGLNSAMQSVALVVGPAIGGVLVGAVHTNAALLLDSATFVASSVTLFLARPPAVVGEPAEDGAEQVPTTWRSVGAFLRGSAVLKMALLITFVVNLAYAGLTEVALPSFAITPLGVGATGFGVMIAGYGIGAALGALLSNRFDRLPHRGLLALGIGVSQGLVLACAPLGSALGVVVAAMFAAAALQSVCSVFFLTSLQREVPDAMLGRVMSMLAAAVGCAYPLSVVIAGALAAASGAGVVIVAAGAAIAAAFCVGFASRRFRSL
ncbi:MAG TPA: MFS transporter [Pseudonocardiaceae bacterium]|nr:MFS transporter [Pseudonocardiaceae bacterium]